MTTPNVTLREKADLPLVGRLAELRNFSRGSSSDGEGADAPLVSVELVFSAGAAVRRYDWFRERYYDEVLVVDESAIRLDRLKRGAPLLNTHSSWSLEDQIGVVEEPAVDGGVATCKATFSRRESVAGFVKDVQDNIIRNVSVGYVRHAIEMNPPVADGGVWQYRVIDWEPYEVSFVPLPADPDAQVIRSANAKPDADALDQSIRTFSCSFISPTVGASAATPTQQENRSMGADTNGVDPTEKRSNETKVADASKPAVEAALTAERQRSADILALCKRHGQEELAADYIAKGKTLDETRAAILEAQVSEDEAKGGQRNVRVETVRDEMQTRVAGIENAILHRIDPKAKLDDNGRAFRGMSLIEIGRDFLESRGENTRGMDRMQLAQRILHFRSGGSLGTSDFSSLFANVANKRLRGAYDENPGTYAVWARRAPNAPDFKNMSVVQLSGAPDLLKVNEAGEFKYGQMSDGAETYALSTFGRIVSLNRQAIVNDDLRGFERLITAFGASSRRLENRTVYAQLTSNPSLSDGVALFHTSRGNLLTGAPSVLQLSSLTTGRSGMRLQKGLAGEELNLAPSYLIVPAQLEQSAYQLTSANYVPAKSADVNEFRSGGRTSLTPVVEPILDGSSATAWYLASENSQIDTVEYCYLDGADGPVIESEVGFETDGISYKCRLDFVAKALDGRGLLKSNGA